MMIFFGDSRTRAPIFADCKSGFFPFDHAQDDRPGLEPGKAQFIMQAYLCAAARL